MLNKIKIKDNKIKIKNKINKINKINNNEKKIKYGQIQYDIINYDNNEIKTKYQNINIINKYDKPILLDNKPNDMLNFKKNTITNLPCQQDIIYDTRFYQPSDKDTYKPYYMNDLNKIEYKERKIQEIYDEAVNNKKSDKKQIYNFSEFDTGASGLKTYKNIEWMYEDENDDMSYDPNMSTISAI